MNKTKDKSLRNIPILVTMVKLDGVSEISDYKSSDNNILHKIYQIQELICDQNMSKDKK